MAWEGIQERLTKAFPVQIALPAGFIWLTDAHLNIDNWLTSSAKTDEELKELDLPRIRFLQNHWPFERLIARTYCFSARASIN